MARKPKTRDQTGASRHELSFLPAPDSVAGQHYSYVTLRFWPSLVFILPMLVVHELGTWLRQGQLSGVSDDLVAAYLVERLVNLFGGTAFSLLPGLLVVAVLLACHLVSGHPWRFDPWVLVGMLGESLVWVVPLFVLDRVLQGDGVMNTAMLVSPPAVRDIWLDKVIRNFGVGIYEELVFRFISMNLLHLLLVDVLKFPRTGSNVFVIVASALIFAGMHHPPLGCEPFEASRFVFRTAAGLYLAGLFFYRGFGIAAGCHSFYNIIVVTLGAIQG